MEMKYREMTSEEVLSAAFTLLTKLEVVTVEEVNAAMINGYSGVWGLLNEKYKKLLEQGIISQNK